MLRKKIISCVLFILLASSFMLGCYNDVIKTRNVPYQEWETVTETQYFPETINGEIRYVPREVQRKVPVTKFKNEEYTEQEFAPWRTIFWWIIVPAIIIAAAGSE